MKPRWRGAGGHVKPRSGRRRACETQVAGRRRACEAQVAGRRRACEAQVAGRRRACETQDCLEIEAQSGPTWN